MMNNGEMITTAVTQSEKERERRRKRERQWKK
jgi:hypothetical protein